MQHPLWRAGLGAGALLTVATVAAVVVVQRADAATDTLLSQGKPATSSSVESPELGPELAFDGDGDTRWGSEEGSDPQWIQVDLGAVHGITRVKLRWEAAYGKAYRIETSADGDTWQVISSTADGDGRGDNLTGLTGSGRYVRLYGTERGTEWGYSLYEFKVYGAAGDAGPPADPPPGDPPPADPPGADPPGQASGDGLFDPDKKDIAMQLVSSAENSSLDWRAQYQYIQDIGDGRGYTAGIVGFCSGTGDMLDLVQLYTDRVPDNVLAKYLPALRSVNGGDSHDGLDPGFTGDWKAAAADPDFQRAQDDERDRVYFNPAVNQAKADGLGTLGQFIYYDAIVMHGPGSDPVSFGGIRATAMAKAKTPTEGGDEATYLNAFLDARVAAMQTEEAHSDTSRVDDEQRVFLAAGNFDLNPPLSWHVYGEPFSIGG
ncbi:chitosanase [Dactylosporangium sp. CA-092794]|uniref:chitosanase n=1 Tax=Dactylosporangium sp. CA-092794 TaxID=3239929 RepID=UPI003D8A498E